MPDITKEQIAAALGVSADDLLAALSTARVTMTNRALEAALARAREKSAALLSDARNAIAPALQALAEKESLHAQSIAEIEGLKDAYAAGQISVIPDIAAIIAGIE